MAKVQDWTAQFPTSRLRIDTNPVYQVSATALDMWFHEGLKYFWYWIIYLGETWNGGLDLPQMVTGIATR